jgi:predicted nucleic acid-binding protein
LTVILIDTSAWIEYLRGTDSHAAQEVERRLTGATDQVVMTAPIAMELLAGAPNASALLALETLTNGLPWLDIDVRLDFHAAAAVYRTGRARGYTVRSLVDCLIAVVAARHGVTLLHRDADFDTLDACLPELGTISLT